MGPLYREHDAQLRARVPYRKWREREGLCNVHLDLPDLFPRTSLSTKRLEKLLGNVASQEERPQMMNIQDSPTKKYQPDHLWSDLLGVKKPYPHVQRF